MLLERTIAQLDIGRVTPDLAAELGALGYMQWLGGSAADGCYRDAAMRAYACAQPFIRNSPAVAVFCDLLVASTRSPLEPLSLSAPTRKRRGGAAERRRQRLN